LGFASIGGGDERARAANKVGWGKFLAREGKLSVNQGHKGGGGKTKKEGGAGEGLEITNKKEGKIISLRTGSVSQS